MFRVTNNNREYVVRTFKFAHPLFELGWFLGSNAIENEIIGDKDGILILIPLRTGGRMLFGIDEDGTITNENEQDLSMDELMDILLNADTKRYNY